MTTTNVKAMHHFWNIHTPQPKPSNITIFQDCLLTLCNHILVMKKRFSLHIKFAFLVLKRVTKRVYLSSRRMDKKPTMRWNEA
jgi:hypothetical protein